MMMLMMMVMVEMMEMMMTSTCCPASCQTKKFNFKTAGDQGRG